MFVYVVRTVPTQQTFFNEKLRRTYLKSFCFKRIVEEYNEFLYIFILTLNAFMFFPTAGGGHANGSNRLVLIIYFCLCMKIKQLWTDLDYTLSVGKVSAYEKRLDFRAPHLWK